MSGSDFRIHFRTDFALFALFPRLFSLLFHSSAHQFRFTYTFISLISAFGSLIDTCICAFISLILHFFPLFHMLTLLICAFSHTYFSLISLVFCSFSHSFPFICAPIFTFIWLFRTLLSLVRTLFSLHLYLFAHCYLLHSCTPLTGRPRDRCDLPPPQLGYPLLPLRFHHHGCHSLRRHPDHLHI
jgi:hypothetical protein